MKKNGLAALLLNHLSIDWALWLTLYVEVFSFKVDWNFRSNVRILILVSEHFFNLGQMVTAYKV